MVSEDTGCVDGKAITPQIAGAGQVVEGIFRRAGSSRDRSSELLGEAQRRPIGSNPIGLLVH